MLPLQNAGASACQSQDSVNEGQEYTTEGLLSLVKLPLWLPISVYAWLVQQVVFHAVGFLFEWLDRHSTMPQLKVRNIEKRSYIQLLPRVLFNQIFILLPCMMAAERLGFCFTRPPQRLPLPHFLLSLLAMAVGHDIVQYTSHRFFLHQPGISLMKALKHSVHHSTGATKAISACYMSGPDFFLEIVLPYLVPLALVGGGGSDVLFHSTVAGLGAVGGLYEHSGYDFSAPLRKSRGSKSFLHRLMINTVLCQLLDNRAHNEHHLKANVSFSDGFGSPGICDSLLGTRWDIVTRRYSEEAEKEWHSQRSQLLSTLTRDPRKQE